MGQRILITGAASGLGRALAGAAVADGAAVLLSDVDAAAGELARLELAEVLRESGDDPQRVAFLSLDVREQADWDRARAWCLAEWGGLDVLVNNAGVAVGGPIAHTPMADWDWIIDINLKGVVRGVRTFLPVFTAQGGGHVVNIASLAGLLYAPNMAAYNVTKAGVVALSETMRAELASAAVVTTVVCPSFFATNIAANGRATDPVYAEIVAKLVSGEVLPGPKLTAEDVARKVLRAVARRRFWCLPHREGRALWWVKRYLPPLHDAGMRAGTRLIQKLAARAPDPSAVPDQADTPA